MPTAYKRRLKKEDRNEAETGGILVGVGIVIVVFWAVFRVEFLKGTEQILISWNILGVILSLLSGILLFLGYYLKEYYEKAYFALLRSTGVLLLVIVTGGLTTYLGFVNMDKVVPLNLMIFLITIIVSYILIASGTFLICRETFKEKEIERGVIEEEII